MKRLRWVTLKFVRVPFLWGWTIGYDLKNGCLLQFTKDVPHAGGHYILNLWAFSYRRSVKHVDRRDKDRIWVGFGWSQGWSRLWFKPGGGNGP